MVLLDLSSERDLFGTVITSAIGLLVQDMEYSCHAALQAMLKSNWSSVDKVTGKIKRLSLSFSQDFLLFSLYVAGLFDEII